MSLILIILSIILGIVGALLMYWECKDRRKFVDQEIPFTAKYYSKQAQPTRMTEADQHKREDKVKENEY